MSNANRIDSEDLSLTRVPVIAASCLISFTCSAAQCVLGTIYVVGQDRTLLTRFLLIYKDRPDGCHALYDVRCLYGSTTNALQINQ